MQKSLSKHFDKFGKRDIPVWVNLGKSKLTENNDAHNDYSTTLEQLWKCSIYLLSAYHLLIHPI